MVEGLLGLLHLDPSEVGGADGVLEGVVNFELEVWREVGNAGAYVFEVMNFAADGGSDLIKEKVVAMHDEVSIGCDKDREPLAIVKDAVSGIEDEGGGHLDGPWKHWQC